MGVSGAQAALDAGPLSSLPGQQRMEGPRGPGHHVVGLWDDQVVGRHTATRVPQGAEQLLTSGSWGWTLLPEQHPGECQAHQCDGASSGLSDAGVVPIASEQREAVSQGPCSAPAGRVHPLGGLGRAGAQLPSCVLRFY